MHQHRVKCFILSTETNKVVAARARKLKVEVIQGSHDKWADLQSFCAKKGFSPGKLAYLGNDLNDYQAMKNCAHSFCPADSHPKILEIAKMVLRTKGGEGVVREFVEDILGLGFITY